MPTLTRNDLVLLHTLVNIRADNLRRHLQAAQVGQASPDTDAIRRADAMYLRDLQALERKVDAMIDEAPVVA